ncbi:MAG: hypothetical protein HN729_06135 [Candidatus Marinimicrobia bacterium]|nr:hypothetical protein [Candidatus Neomarinimicrobiota bacterium]MBT3633924.1 hypothetical protein [Candidatus Neomarinimicrobiota bacterium]MBT3682827.1 hypothetical protein [Candidatus Neomarinimicrobiota bacterium]MBT3759986.1 hypothetical protein [Candidatus Neomarinimicrobiota bacterium]MBT3896080.1 hypothetical protein [Candidatus Neomarinimicrobiota bacterium]
MVSYSFLSRSTLVVLFVLPICLFCSDTEKNLAKTLSSIPHQNLNYSNIIISSSVFGADGDVRGKINSQIWITSNLFLKGGISPEAGDLGSNLLMHTGIGFTPKFTVFNLDPLNLEFGVHQLKWHEENNYRWYFTGISSSYSISEFQVHFSWTHLFNDNWDHYQFSTSIFHNITNNFSINGGVRIYKDGNNIKVLPALTLSTVL